MRKTLFQLNALAREVVAQPADGSILGGAPRRPLPTAFPHLTPGMNTEEWV